MKSDIPTLSPTLPRHDYRGTNLLSVTEVKDILRLMEFDSDKTRGSRWTYEATIRHEWPQLLRRIERLWEGQNMVYTDLLRAVFAALDLHDDGIIPKMGEVWGKRAGEVQALVIGRIAEGRELHEYDEYAEEEEEILYIPPPILATMFFRVQRAFSEAVEDEPAALFCSSELGWHARRNGEHLRALIVAYHQLLADRGTKPRSQVWSVSLTVGEANATA